VPARPALLVPGLLALLVLATTSCAPPDPPRVYAPPQADVSFSAPGLYPEGVAFDPTTNGFFVSSLRTGAVGRVMPDGTYELFAEPGLLVSTQGMAVDAARGRLLVVGGDLGVGERSSAATQEKQAGLGIYDLATGARLAYYALDTLVPGRRRHANDLALGADGTAYVTDSFAGVIYQVTRYGGAAVLAESPEFASEGVGLNGIAVHPDRFLLAAHSESGRLVRVGLDTATVERVALPEALVGADGLVLLSPDSLVVVQNEGHDRTLLLHSDDGWRSATVAAEVPSPLPFPTTAVRAGGAVYVLNAKLEELFDPQGTRSSGFLLQRVTF
jgi:sugar lactone lactonase YvrE